MLRRFMISGLVGAATFLIVLKLAHIEPYVYALIFAAINFLVTFGVWSIATMSLDSN